ncbi:MAG: phage virion morphogenesis protein [Thiomonas sp.]
MLEGDFSAVIAQMDAIIKRSLDLTQPLAIIGALETAKAHDRLQNSKTDPDGDAWIPWRPSTKRERIRQGTAGTGLLWITGGIARSIDFDFGVTVGEDRLEIGSSNKLALFHQFGTRGPGTGPSGYHDVPRPFLGWDEDDLPNYAQMIADYIREGL